MQKPAGGVSARVRRPVILAKVVCARAHSVTTLMEAPHVCRGNGETHLVRSLLRLHWPLHRRSLGKGSWRPGGGLGCEGLWSCAAWLGFGQGRVLLLVHPRSFLHLARPGRLAGAAAAVGQGRPVSGRRRLWPRELLLLKGLEVGVLLLQLPLEPLRLPLLLQLLPLVLLGPRQGALSARP